MKVLLVEDVENLGRAGEVQDVADGYGRNYLIPQGLAVLATPGALKQAEAHRRRAEKKRLREAAEVAAFSQAIEDVSLTFTAKCGSTGRLYGSITTSDIAEALGAKIEREIDRRKITLEESIKQVGSHEVQIRLSADVIPAFTVVVEPEDPDVLDIEPEEEPEAGEGLTEQAETEEGQAETE